MSSKPKAKPNSISKKGKFRLAAACAEVMSDEQVAWWLREVMAGRDPDAPRDADGNLIQSPVDFLIPGARPSWTDRMKAAKMFLERRNGLPTQQVVIEQEIASQAAISGAVVARAVVTALGPNDRREMRAILARNAGRAIDAVSTEVPAAEAAED